MDFSTILFDKKRAVVTVTLNHRLKAQTEHADGVDDLHADRKLDAVLEKN
jgi:hypothetical protein